MQIWIWKWLTMWSCAQGSHFYICILQLFSCVNDHSAWCCFSYVIFAGWHGNQTRYTSRRSYRIRGQGGYGAGNDCWTWLWGAEVHVWHDAQGQVLANLLLQMLTNQHINKSAIFSWHEFYVVTTRTKPWTTHFLKKHIHTSVGNVLLHWGINPASYSSIQVQEDRNRLTDSHDVRGKSYMYILVLFGSSYY